MLIRFFISNPKGSGKHPSGEIIIRFFRTTRRILPHVPPNISSHYFESLSTSPFLTLCIDFLLFSRRYDSRLLFVCARWPAAGCSGLRAVDLGVQAQGHRQDHPALQKEIWHFTNKRPCEQPDGALQKHFPERVQTALSGASGPSGEQARLRDLHLPPSAKEEQGRPGHGRGHSGRHA